MLRKSAEKCWQRECREMGAEKCYNNVVGQILTLAKKYATLQRCSLYTNIYTGELSFMAEKRSLSLATKILIAMIIGAAFGAIFKSSYAAWGAFTGPLGTVFIRLLKMTILPLIFFSIVTGVASVADLSKLKKVGGTFLGFWFTASALCAATGIVCAYIIKPGEGIHLEEAAEKFSTEGVSVVQSLVNWVPDNVGAAFANFNIIQVIIFSLFLGIGIALLSNDNAAKAPLQNFFNCGKRNYDEGRRNGNEICACRRFLPYGRRYRYTRQGSSYRTWQNAAYAVRCLRNRSCHHSSAYALPCRQGQPDSALH